jgi:TonB family protein
MITVPLILTSWHKPTPIPPPAVADEAKVHPKVLLFQPEVAKTPPAPERKQRISVGAPDPRRAEKLLLERDRDISRDAPAPGPAGPPIASPSPVPEKREAAVRAPGLIAPSDDATKPSILSSLKGLERRLAASGGADGLSTTATGKEVSALAFDPQGADFTQWVNHFKNQIYRNWIVPQSAFFGFGGGEVQIAFTVDRGGAVLGAEILRSCGTPALDRAARNAILSSLFLPLPSDYRPATLDLTLTFGYHVGRRS